MLPSLTKEVVEQGSAELVSRHLRKMADSELGGDFGRAFLIAKEQDFGARVEARPTGDGVALDGGNVAAKIFGNGEQR